MEMTSKQIERIEQDLNIIRKRMDRCWDKMIQAEKDGDMERYHKFDRADDLLQRELDGMETVLNILGVGIGHGEDKNGNEHWFLTNMVN